ncbi:hypothetical protein [Actinoplanes sp. NBRC 103695]|uniref:hypothetical protein n=1 Tax=Actinoplanes sp. NBRC 103695 TaxID=3032202 RepID=UPI0024A59748|nr:hypothetical protein [Actinoplanes sp. NBRC 103695]GLY94061.1 hypothetical protein Acsp02_13170 [Actinoplanes sp. NBRC 103695]
MAISECDARRAVVLVDGAGADEFRAVRDALTDAWNIPVVLLGPAELAGSAVCWDAEAGVLSVDGGRVRPAVVWTRHCAPGTLVARASLTATGADAWSGLVTALTAAADAALPGPARGHHPHLAQARRLGVRVPRTLVTTGPADGLPGSPRTVVKHPDFRLTEPDPRCWAPYLPVITEKVAAATPGRPVVVQEYIEHDHELRVYHLDGTLCAFRVAKHDPAAMWTDPAGVEVTPVVCPPAAASVVRRLASGWGLRYAAFDLLVTRTSEVVFLEANPDGDWLWFERRARWHGVSLPAAVMVRELFARTTSTGDHADERADT